MGYSIVLYDGVCGLCNRFVQFILKYDRARLFRFAPLQSEFGAGVLSHYEASAQLDTIYVAPNYDPATKGERTIFARSEAVIFILRRLGGIWSPVAVALRLIPRPVRDWGYNFVAHRRYWLFGRYETCPLPTAETKARFLDQ